MNQRIALVYQNVRIPFIFEVAAAAGIDITLIHAPESFVPDNLPAVTQTVALDIYPDQDAAIQVLQDLHRRVPFDGIFAPTDHPVPFVSRAAAALGLPGLPEEVALVARDKRRMRERFRAANLNCPAFVRINAPEDIARAEALRFPVVVKPTSGFSSQGVIRVDRPQDVAHSIAMVEAINRENLAKFAHKDQPEFTGVLIEEFIDGPEYAVESFSHKGKVHVLSIGYKGNPKGPYFEETIYLAPAPLLPHVQAAVVDQVRRAVIALGITDGPSHTEVRLQNGTIPYVLEIGARMGGSGVSHFIVSESTGINFMGLALDQVLGQADCTNLPTEPQPIATAGNYIIPVKGHGIVSHIEGLDDLHRYPDVKRILQFVSSGDEIQPYPRWSAYPGFIFTRHSSYAAGEEFYRMLDEKIVVRYRST